MHKQTKRNKFQILESKSTFNNPASVFRYIDKKNNKKKIFKNKKRLYIYNIYSYKHKLLMLKIFYLLLYQYFSQFIV